MQIIKNAAMLAHRENFKSGVMLFKNHVKPSPPISSLEERVAVIEKTGVDFIYLCEFDEDFKNRTPEDFILFLKDTLHAAAVFAGYNYRFGRGAAADAGMLCSLAEKQGIDAFICPKIEVDGETVSSTAIRQMLSDGELSKAKKFLKHPFFVSGTVMYGFQNGRKIGFPTANLMPDEGRVLPPDGVYSGRTLWRGVYYPSVVNIGKNPTFNAQKRTVESHLIGVDKDLYNEKAAVEFKTFLRGEKHFGSIEELKNQVQKDKERAEREMMKFHCVILAAGMGTRMKSDTPKVLHKICGKTLVEWVLKAAKGAGVENSCVIVGHKAQMVKDALGEQCEFAEQTEQKGTGHAVMQARDFIKKNGGVIMILTGDAPLVSEDMLKNAMDTHIKSGCDATFITAVFDNPSGYGRIVRAGDGSVLKIVEEKDATDEEKKICEINAGMYIFDSRTLLESLDCLEPNNAQGEYYLTDTLEIILKNGGRVGAFVTGQDEIKGINDRIQLAEAEKLMQARINKWHMKNGVTVMLPETVIIEDGVEIGSDSIIYPNVIIKSGTKIGRHCSIGSGTQIENSVIADGVEILNSVLLDCSVGSGTHVGPFAYLRPDTHVGENVRVGDFVELKNSNIGDGTKISHLTYVGDSDVGKRVNFGCGTVTVNYDGAKKYRTKIGDDCFIGCNTNLVAPVTVEDGGYTAAGSTITDTVPENALAIARARQVNKTEWKDRRKK